MPYWLRFLDSPIRRNGADDAGAGVPVADAVADPPPVEAPFFPEVEEPDGGVINDLGVPVEEDEPPSVFDEYYPNRERGEADAPAKSQAPAKKQGEEPADGEGADGEEQDGEGDDLAALYGVNLDGNEGQPEGDPSAPGVSSETNLAGLAEAVREIRPDAILPDAPEEVAQHIAQLYEERDALQDVITPFRGVMQAHPVLAELVADLADAMEADSGLSLEAAIEARLPNMQVLEPDASGLAQRSETAKQKQRQADRRSNYVASLETTGAAAMERLGLDQGGLDKLDRAILPYIAGDPVTGQVPGDLRDVFHLWQNRSQVFQDLVERGKRLGRAEVAQARGKRPNKITPPMRPTNRSMRPVTNGRMSREEEDY